jgi:dienelactone hydrolase
VDAGNSSESCPNRADEAGCHLLGSSFREIGGLSVQASGAPHWRRSGDGSPSPGSGRGIKENKLMLHVLLSLLLLFATPAPGAQEPSNDGAIVEPAAPYVYPAYSALPEWMKRAYTPEAYEQYVATGPEITRLKYRSGGLNIGAFVVRPRQQAASPLPIVVYNRGGVGEQAKIGATNFLPLDEMRRFADAGFVVVASQYRGVDDSGGRDEVGGRDLDDLMNLRGVLNGLEGVDRSRVFLVGYSRGGQMTLQALRKGFPARAAAVIGAPTDWEAAQRLSPRLAQLAREHWPDFASRHAEHAFERSAVRWPEAISAPLLIFHGGADQAVPVSQALDLAARLSEAKSPYELIVYNGDDHLVTGNLEDRIRRTVAWFRAHDVQPAPPKSAAAVVVSARDYAFDLPDAIRGGLVTFQFVNRGAEPHYLRFLRILDGKAVDDVLEWRRTRTPMPPWLEAAGGVGTVAPGKSAEFTMRIAQGRLIAMCGHPSPDGTFHVDKGMIRLIQVGAERTDPAPTSARRLELHDRRFDFTPPTGAGRQSWHIVNRGTTVHQALLVKLPAGVTVDDELGWFRNGSKGVRPGLPVGGVIELAAGSEAWYSADLEPGEYALLCAAGGAAGRHFDHGMIARFSLR